MKTSVFSVLPARQFAVLSLADLHVFIFQYTCNIVARVPSIPDQSRAHMRITCAHVYIYIKLPYFSSFLFLRRL